MVEVGGRLLSRSRLPYYVVTKAREHREARTRNSGSVDVRRTDEVLVVEIVDDGVGGATASVALVCGLPIGSRLGGRLASDTGRSRAESLRSRAVPLPRTKASCARSRGSWRRRC
jgi:hypothetical protein